MIEWATLSPFVPLLIVVLAVAVAALSAAAVLVARRSIDPADDSLGAAEGLQVIYLGRCGGTHADGIEKAMATGNRELRRSGLAEAPRFLMVGESGSGKSTLLAQSGLPHPFGGGQGPSPLDLWLFSDTVVFDPKGELMLRRDGRSHDEEGWQCLLRHLRETRPRRPLDGVVLTIPADRLRVDDLEKDGAALQADASLRANALFERLAELQQILGMRLPVDVVITRADMIPGWRAWTAPLTPQQEQQIFGWSSPYAAEAPYQASWTDEAFSTIGERLDQTLAATFARGDAATDGAALLDFPGQVSALEPATRIYLNHLFSESAFVESFMLRGLYFTGGASSPGAGGHPDVVGLCPAPQQPAPARPGVPERILFAHDLLQRKAFPENALGQFTESASRSAKATTRLAQAAALAVPVLVLAGQLFDHHRLSDRSASLAPAVTRIAADLDGAARQHPVRHAGDRVEDFAAVDDYILRGFFLPPSWWSSQHGDVRRAFAASYDDVIFPALRRQLQHWRDELSTPWPPPAPGPRITTVEDTPEFGQLQAFADQLDRFDDDVWLYDCLAAHCVSGSGALSTFDRLSKDLLDVPLRLPSAAARRFHARRLERVHTTPFAVDDTGRAALTAQARRLSTRLDRRLFDDNPVLQDLRELNAEIERLEQLDAGATAADYRLLDERIHSLQEELQRPEIAWMGQDSMTPGPVVLATYAELAASPSVGPDAVADMAAEADRDFTAMRREMAQLQNPSTGPILARNDAGSAQLALSQGVQDLDAAVEKLLGESFMAEEPQRTLTVPGDLQRLFWSQSGLKKTTDLVTSYQSFLDGGVSPFPDDLQGTTEEVALQTLAEHMIDALAAAQSLRPAPSRVSAQTLERGLAMQVRNYTASAASLAQILDDFQSLQLYDAYDQLTAVLTVEQTHLLEDLDALLDLEPLFQPVDDRFGWWRGVQPPAPPA
ncbi:MAG: type VI secretion system protein, partial [Acidobacteriota bacterium]